MLIPADSTIAPEKLTKYLLVLLPKVEYYPMPNPEEDGYSLEGFNIPEVTIEVSASQIMPLHQWQKEIALIPVDIFRQNSFG